LAGAFCDAPAGLLDGGKGMGGPTMGKRSKQDDPLNWPHGYSNDKIARRVGKCHQPDWDGRLFWSSTQCTVPDLHQLAADERICQTLTALELGWNNLSDARALAEGLKALTKLSTLDLSGNELSDARALAQGLKLLTKLSTLYLGGNELSDARALADGLKALTRLIELDLGGNLQIKAADILALRVLLPPRGQLRWLSVKDNPQLQLPDEVVKSRDAARILAELQRLRQAIRQIKIVVLGDGEMGKTQLVNRLRGEAFEEKADRTLDFEMHSLEFKKAGPAGEAVTAWLYDFGGQAHLWSAHRFFLASQHNLYIVVIDGTRQDEDRLDYWLRYIRHYVGRQTAAESAQGKIPILVVFTNCDRTAALASEGRNAFTTISEKEAAKLVKGCAGFADVRVVREYSSKTDRGLRKVQWRLRKLIGRMDYVFRTQYADSLHRVKDSLEGDEVARADLKAGPFEQSLPIDALNELFRRAQEQIDGSVDEGAFPIWLQILRNLGVLHWVGDVPGVQPGVPIARTVYHPDWVRKLVYGIVRADASIRKDGVTDEPTLCGLMCAACKTHEGGRDRQTQVCHREILELMQACHLIFLAKDRADPRWLVLDWLGPTTGFVFDYAPACVLEFDDYLPDSLLLRFAGEWFSQIAGGEAFNCLSREHIVVRQWEGGNAQAAIKADWRTRRIVVWSLGGTAEQRDELVAQVKVELLKQARGEGLAPRTVAGVAVAPVELALSNDAKDQKLTGLVMVAVAEANQICRLETMYDKGIDAHIEFLEDSGDASGCRAYLQLKSGDSYVRVRERDGQEIFDVKNERHLKYWVSQPCDVHLVIADSRWLVRWMNVTRYLNQRPDKTSRQIVFNGELLTPQTVLRLRKQCLDERKTRRSSPG